MDITKKEYVIMCKVYLNHKGDFKSYTELGKEIKEVVSSPIFSKVITLLKSKSIIKVKELNGKSEMFNVDKPKLFDLIQLQELYKTTELVMHKRDKFAITP